MKGFSSKRIALRNRCYRTGKYTGCRRVHASFSPEIVQAGVVKGLITDITGAAVGVGIEHKTDLRE